MAILEVLGFRSLLWSESRQVFVSPQHKETAWKSPMVRSTCRYCPKDDFGLSIIQQNCECGIHLTEWAFESKAYMATDRHVMIMCEAIGPAPNYYNVHTGGVTAPAALVVGVMNLSKWGEEFGLWRETDEDVVRKIGIQQFLMWKAKEVFKCEIMDYRLARRMAKLQWEKRAGLPWNDRFDTMNEF